MIFFSPPGYSVKRARPSGSPSPEMCLATNPKALAAVTRATSRSRAQVNRPTPVRVDWAVWDEKLAVGVETAAKAIKQVAGRPARVSLTEIVKLVGHRDWLERKLDRLPLTAKALSEHLESMEDYLIRKVEWAEGYCRREGLRPARYLFEIYAGIGGRKGRTRKVEEAACAAFSRLVSVSTNAT